MLSRRAFLALSAALAAAPRRALAASPGVGLPDRKYLFIFARGGWDPSWCFAPDADATMVDGDPSGTAAEVSGIPFVDSGARPAVRQFFEDYGSLACVLNGIEVRSLTHERCRRLILCGSNEADGDDWPVTLAAQSAPTTLPHLVLTGPAFTSRYASSAVRLGGNNQLAELLSGSYDQHAGSGLRPLSAAHSQAAADFARARAQAWAGSLKAGQARDWGEDLLRSYDQLDLSREIADRLEVEGIGSDTLIPVPDRVAPALRCFSEGITRCAIVEHLGLYDLSWDTHSGNDMQGAHYQALFDDLRTIAATMGATPGTAGGSLLDETTVVVFSEMGRTPRLNAAGGKDHWTFTSTLLFGAGVRGGQAIGGYSAGMVGQPVDLGTGALDAEGTALVPEHLGATLFAMAGLDPAEYVDAEPIDAAVEGR